MTDLFDLAAAGRLSGSEKSGTSGAFGAALLISPVSGTICQATVEEV